MQLFYTPPERISENRLEINGEEVIHITKSLRHKVGDTIKVLDGKGTEYTVMIKEHRRDNLVCDIIEKRSGVINNKRELTLFQAIPKQGKMDFVIEKATELGVKRIVPIITKYSVCVPGNEDNKLRHWNNIAVSAMKQSMGVIVPKISGLINFNIAVEEIKDFELPIIAHNDSNSRYIREIVKDVKTSALFIGPEGGFSEEEVKLAVEKGAIPASFGVKRLRSETAAIAGCALLLI
ncbi:MAG: RsmE family RNA methyltransferase [bacterium]|nr:RsmE family RNA methyltransferase [bacterium]